MSYIQSVTDDVLNAFWLGEMEVSCVKLVYRNRLSVCVCACVRACVRACVCV